jgi:hypothetical protein
MENQAQRPIRWVLVAALLAGAAVWYSWNAHREPGFQEQAFAPPPREEAQLNRAAIEVAPAQDDASEQER